LIIMASYSQVPIDATKKVKPQRIQVSNVDNMEHAKFCEPVLKSNSSQVSSRAFSNPSGPLAANAVSDITCPLLGVVRTGFLSIGGQCNGDSQ